MSFWYKSAEDCQCHPSCSCQAERQGPWTSCLEGLWTLGLFNLQVNISLYYGNFLTAVLLIEYFILCFVIVNKVCTQSFVSFPWQNGNEIYLRQWEMSSEKHSATPTRLSINSHAYTCIHHRIQLAVGDMTMSGWKPTISLIHPSIHRLSIAVSIHKLGNKVVLVQSHLLGSG